MMSEFKIPFPKLPSDEELQQSSARWLARVGPCFIDQWPSDLVALSADTHFIDIPRDMVRMFDSDDYFFGVADEIAKQADEVCGWQRKFFRLNSRSPKDAPWPFETLASCSGKEMLSVMRASERMLDDLARFYHSTATPKLCLREFWPGVGPAFEFRCFIINGQVAAVAEYLNAWADKWELPMPEHDADLREKIDGYLVKTVIPRLHLQTVVIDLAMLNGRDLRLLEINPYGLSDPVGAVSYEFIERGIGGIARLSREAGDE
jgi:hypothetical protein